MKTPRRLYVKPFRKIIARVQQGAARRTNEYVVYIFCGLIVESHIDPFAVMIYYRYSKSMKNKVFL